MGKVHCFLLFFISAAVGICFLLCVGCSNVGKTPPIQGAVPSGEQSLTEVLGQLDSLQAPPSADQALFKELKAELSRQLESSGRQKFTSRLAIGLINDFIISQNGDGTITVSWSYKNVGDYDLNGEVNISDITPLVINFGATINESNRDLIGHIDGDGNGEINLSDITAIVVNYLGLIEGYMFQSNRYPGNETTWETIGIFNLYELGFNDRDDSNLLTFTIPMPCLQLEFRVVAFVAEETGEGSNSEQPENQPEPELPVITGTISDLEGLPIMATISIPGLEPMLADENGRFSITLDDPAQEYVATFSADGYSNTTKPLALGSTSQQNYSISMKPVDAVLPVLPAELSMLSMLNGVSVVLPPGSLVDSFGVPMVDATQAELTFFDPTDPAQLAAAPGDFTAIQLDETEVELETFGMLEVRIDDGNGGLANLGEGQEVPVTFPVAEEMRGRAPETIGLYSFDDATGKWIEEGIATLDESGEFYIANVTHFSTWNWDRVQETTAIHVLVQGQNGVAVEGAEVVASGVDYSGDRRAFTDENGLACVLVKRDSLVDVTAIYFDYVSAAVQATTPDTIDRCENPAQTPLVATLEIPIDMLYPPDVVFTASPSFGEPPLTVSFDASECIDRDGGQIVKYEWNFDTEASPLAWQDYGDNPFAQFTYLEGAQADSHAIAGLRVTDDEGQVSTAYVVICLHGD